MTSSLQGGCNHVVISTALRIFTLFLLLVHLCLLSYVDSFQPSPTTTSTTSRLERAVQKVNDRLTSFGQLETATLVIDANNVRGIGKFQWNPLQLQQRVDACCTGRFGIRRIVIVWDHGGCPTAIPLNNDSIVLFSGLFQRADDVIEKEARHLSSSSLCATGWESLAFVTNDGGLVSRLRQGYSTSRNLTGSEHETQHDSVGQPLLIDSNCFVQLLSSIEEEDIDARPFAKIELVLNATQENLRRFAVCKLRHGRNPRREKTWQRCVLAERLRQSLGEHYIASGDAWADDDNDVSFSKRYLRDLEDRGFIGAPDVSRIKSSSGEIGGPARLDKRQKRLLGRYNAFARMGRTG